MNRFWPLLFVALAVVGCRKPVPTPESVAAPEVPTETPVQVAADSLLARQRLLAAMPGATVIQALSVPLPGAERQAVAVGLVSREGTPGKLIVVRADSALVSFSSRTLVETGALYHPRLMLVPDLDGDGLAEVLLEERSAGSEMVSITLTLIDLESNATMVADGFLGDPARTTDAPATFTTAPKLPVNKRQLFQRFLRKKLADAQSRVGLAAL